MASNKQSGDIGEKEVVQYVPCPNCNKELMLLPANYPLYDVQCTGCNFRAQVKTNKSKPKKEIFGAGWQIMDKVLKSGFITPALIANFKWTEKGKERQEIRFYPFVSKKNLKRYQLPPTAKRANYWMFNYTGLDKLPYIVVYEKQRREK
jgi:DNA-directed RNA polymerase subunit RPC12/RpoP